MISSRYAVPVLVLLVLALVPTVIHSYVGLVVDDGHRSSAVPAMMEGFTSVPAKKSATWGKRRFDSDDWFERSYTDGREQLTLTVIRSYDLKSLYHHPELAVGYHEGHTFAAEKIVRFPNHPEMPVHVLRAFPPETAVSMYVLDYDGGFIDDPIRFQIRTAAELLFTGRKPMTLLFVQDPSVPRDADLRTAPVTRLLFAATDSFRAQKTEPISTK